MLEKQIFEIDLNHFNSLPNLSHGTSFYQKINFEDFLLANDRKNNWFLNHDNEIVTFKYAVKKESIILIGSNLQEIEPYFETPINSKYLDIYTSDCKEDPIKSLYHLNKIKCKLVCVKLPTSSKACVFIPLLHTL